MSIAPAAIPTSNPKLCKLIVRVFFSCLAIAFIYQNIYKLNLTIKTKSILVSFGSLTWPFPGEIIEFDSKNTAVKVETTTAIFVASGIKIHLVLIFLSPL